MENDSYWVHRLKQDTVRSRIIGKYHVSLLDFDIPGIIGPVGGFGTAIAMAIAMIKNNKSNNLINQREKVLYSILIPLGILCGVSSTKYIVTGRELFEKKEENKKVVEK